MFGDRPRWMAVALAVTMLTMGLSVVPSASAQRTCDAEWTPTEDGFVMLANPDEEPNRRVSRAMHHFVFQGGGDTNDLGRLLTNGIDAYVFDLGCSAQLDSKLCIRRAATDFGLAGEGIELFEFRGQQETAPDIKIAFYDDDETHMAGENWNPDVPPLSSNLENDGDLVCADTSGHLPEDARYAVVFITSGNPVGVQVDNLLYGPYTSHFDLYYCLTDGTSCQDALPDDG